MLKPYQNKKFRMILLESGGTSEVIDTFYILQDRRKCEHEATTDDCIYNNQNIECLIMTFRNKVKITEVITQVIETLQYQYTSFSIRKITQDIT